MVQWDARLYSPLRFLLPFPPCPGIAHPPLDAAMMNRRPVRRSSLSPRRSIAALAARLMAEDGLSDCVLAKRKAARQLGLPENAGLPDDREVEDALRAYQRLFQDEEQQGRNIALLRAAASLMKLVQRFNPYLTGPVLAGIAGRHAEIDIQLFADSAKDVEVFLLNQRITFHHSQPRSERAEAVLTTRCAETTVNLVVYPHVEERTGFKTRDGRLRERARLDVVLRLLAAHELISR